MILVIIGNGGKSTTFLTNILFLVMIKPQFRNMPASVSMIFF